MSLDYPLYEELRRRRHPAARWWIVGDRLYYVGGLVVVLAVIAALGTVAFALTGRGWMPAIAATAAGVLGVLTNAAGMLMKGVAYGMAERDGIVGGGQKPM